MLHSERNIVLVINKQNKNSSWGSWYSHYQCLLHALRSSFSQLQVPPFEGERLSTHVGSAVHFPQELVVGGKVINEAAVQAKWLEQSAHLGLQGTFTIHLRPKRLGNAQVPP